MFLLDSLFYFFIGIVCIQLVYYLFIFARFLFAKSKQTSKNTFPISILICAKNERVNLQKHLGKFVGLSYPNYEIVLINDRSTDDTLEVMEKFQSTHKNLPIKIVDVRENDHFWGSKKYALSLGIRAATHEHLLFTDADCYPNNKQWIQQMSNGFETNKSIVLGYGAYEKIKGSFLNKLIRMETLIAALQYFSLSKLGQSYMGVGRNLAYTKTQFFAKNGFVNHMNIASGDDDLFVNENSTKENTNYVISPESFTYSLAHTSYPKWLRQKRRHISTAKHYKKKHQLLLATFYSSQVLFWLTFLILMAFTYKMEYTLGFFAFRMLFHGIILIKACTLFEERDLKILLPFLEITLLLNQGYLFIKNSFHKPNHW